jgi:hypothetical protein
MMPRRTVKTKQPANTSGANINPKRTTEPKAKAKPAKPTATKKRATMVGYDSRSAKGIKKLNKSAKQTMTRPGLVTSKATGG